MTQRLTMRICIAGWPPRQPAGSWRGDGFDFTDGALADRAAKAFAPAAQLCGGLRADPF